MISIVNDSPTTIDAAQAFAQINYDDPWRMLRLCVSNRCYSKSDGYIQFDVKITGKRRIIVKLNGSDLYDIEIGRMKKLDYIVLDQIRDIDADNLGRIIEDLAVNNS
jgi:hypothetical protein